MRYGREDRRGFTLIELLVVVAIIVALLAILMPSLNKAIEAATRAACASNQHQVHTILFTWAAEHRGAMPDGDMIKGATALDSIAKAHVTWISGDNYRWMLAYAGGKVDPSVNLVDLDTPAETVYYCPNMRGFERHHSLLGTLATDSFGANYHVRMGFENLYGQNRTPWTGEVNGWVSARRITDPGDAYVLSDAVEYVSTAPYNIWYAHGVNPGVQYANNAPVTDPSLIGVYGSNVARLNGSVAWQSAAALRDHASRSFDNGDWRGRW